jgi:hypothetical protein
MNGMWMALAGEVLKYNLAKWEVLWCGEVVATRYGISRIVKSSGSKVLGEFIELPRMELPE